MTHSKILMKKEIPMKQVECRMEFPRTNRHSSSGLRHCLWVLLLAVATAFLAGCETPSAMTVAFRTPYKPDDVFLADGTGLLPGDIKRVAMLPLACDARQTDLLAGRDTLAPVLFAELIKTKQFEVVQISRAELWRLTGRTDWTGDEVLPADILDLLKKDSGCDAVLFCELTGFRAYPPLAIGWRLKLVAVRQKKTLWAGDEYFDAGNPAVIAAVRHYQRHGQMVLDDGSGGWLAVNSPCRFGQYSIDSLLDTLPAQSAESFAAP
jgi:hypothetical protein